MRRRDPETAKPLKALYYQLGTDRGFTGPRSGLGNWGDKHTEIALVLADGLLQNDYRAVGNDLSRFAKRMQKWMDSARAESGFVRSDHPGMPQWWKWSKILERIEEALRQIERKTASERAWHQRRPHMATVVLRHRIGGLDSIRGPYAITPADAEDLPSLRKWLIKKRFPALGRLRQDWKHRGGAEKYDYGYVELHREGDKVTLYPLKGWHSVTIELGQAKPRLTGRSIARMTDLLREGGYLHPALYARQLFRAGITANKLEFLRYRMQQGAYPTGERGEQEREFDTKYNLRRKAPTESQRDPIMKKRSKRGWGSSCTCGDPPSSRRKVHQLSRRTSEVRALRPRSSTPRGTERPIGGGFILSVYPYPFSRRPVAWHVYHLRNPNEWYAAGEADSLDDAIDAADRKFGVDLRAFARDPRRRPTPIKISPRQRAFISKKIPLLIDEGYPQKQSIAIAYRMAGVPPRAPREGKRKVPPKQDYWASLTEAQFAKKLGWNRVAREWHASKGRGAQQRALELGKEEKKFLKKGYSPQEAYARAEKAYSARVSREHKKDFQVWWKKVSKMKFPTLPLRSKPKTKAATSKRKSWSSTPRGGKKR